MQAPSLPPNEHQRIAALERLLAHVDRGDQRYRQIVEYAATEFDVPICLFTVVGAGRQEFLAQVGMTQHSTARDVSFCGHAILKPEVMVVQDALADARFFDNPLVTGNPNIRFYAGAPLIVEGQAVGTLCIIDSRPRQLAPEDVAVLEDLRDRLARELIAPA
jgi:GAF domain-containing protein